jgi:WD40 repeat protein
MHLFTPLFKSRTTMLSFATLGFISLSACQATTEPTSIRWSEPQFAGIPEAKLSELSGLSRSGLHQGIYWAHNDSDKTAEIYAINAQAQTKAIFSIEAVRNIDWEDITAFSSNDKNYLAIADTGDNGGLRKDLFIHIFEEPLQLAPNGKITSIRSLRFQWPDGARDAESLVADGKRQQFYLISKKRVPAEVFALPFNAKNDSVPKRISTLENIIQPDEKTMNTKGDYGRYRSQITGADISPDGQWLAVLNYQQIVFFNLSAKKIPTHLKPSQTITLPWLPQAEGIAFSADGNSLFIGSEQSPTPIIRYDRIKP